MRIVHFVGGGGHGATRAAIDIALGHKAGARFDAMLIFRRKRTGLPQSLADELNRSGVPWAEVPKAPKWATVARTRALIRSFAPEVLVAHGFSDHIWGRIAAFREKVPTVLMVEQNLERYSWLHRWLSARLEGRTAAIVAVSRGVAQRLRQMGVPEQKIHLVHNGVRLERFSSTTPAPLVGRERSILMCARFARQKDHPTLLRAIRILKQRGIRVKVRLAGGGRTRWRAYAKWLARRLEVEEDVEFLGQRNDIPELLARHRVFVLATRFEGLPLSVAEAMAAGCAVVGTRVCGVEDMIEHGRTGWLAEPRDPLSLADALAAALENPMECQVVADAGRRLALEHFNTGRMVAEIEDLVMNLSTRRT